MGRSGNVRSNVLENFIYLQQKEFNEVIEMLLGFLTRRGWGRQYHDRMDIIGEALCRLWIACDFDPAKAAKILSNQVTFRCWSISAARNVAHEQFRLANSRKKLLESLFEAENCRIHDSSHSRLPQMAEIELALVKCSGVARLVVKLCAEGESQESIAAMLGITRNRVRSHIVEARQIVAAELDLESWCKKSSPGIYPKREIEHLMSGDARKRPRWSSEIRSNEETDHADVPHNSCDSVHGIQRR